MPSPPTVHDPARLTLRGRLLSADSTNQDIIGIVDPSGTKTEVFVPDSMVDDVVKPYYRTEVVAVVRREDGRLVLERVVPAN